MGRFDVWKAGGFVYNNIAGNPVGQWYYWQKNPPRWSKDNPNNNQGFAFYPNGPVSCKYSFFNNVAWGRTNDPKDPAYNYAVFFPNFMLHAWVNNTAYRFGVGVRDGQSQSPAYVPGNLFVDMHTACQIDLALRSTEEQREAHLSRSALSKNVFIGKMGPFWKFSDHGATPTLDETRKFVATGTLVAGDIGTVFPEAPAFCDAERKDFRLVANSPAVGAGVKFFLPFPLNHVVGEWSSDRYPPAPPRSGTTISS